MRQLLVLAGPTAVGKGTLVRELVQRHPHVWVSVSATTRPARSGEIDGVDYLFVSDDEFDELVETDALLEWATVHGVHRYGTPRDPVMRHLEDEVPSILEIDIQGARQVRESLPDALLVFVSPPSWEDLVRRLETRGTESAAQRRRRLATARDEMGAIDEFNHIVVNDTIERAVKELELLLGL